MPTKVLPHSIYQQPEFRIPKHTHQLIANLDSNKSRDVIKVRSMKTWFAKGGVEEL